MTRKNFRLLLLTIFLLGLVLTARAQSVQTLAVTADSLADDQKIALDEGWKYQFGDDAAWAQPNFDDSGWKTKNNISLDDWRGIAWARIRLNVADDLAGVPLNLEMRHWGASEIYLDGKLVGGFGTVGRTLAEEKSLQPNWMPLPVVFSGGEHTIAVRYSNQNAADVHSVIGALIKNADGIRFLARLARFGSRTNTGDLSILSFGYWMAQLFICLSFAVLHLLLFAFYPKQRGNLYYGLYLLTIVISVLTVIPLRFFQPGTLEILFYWVINTLITAPKYLLLLIFLYTVFEGRIPRRIWIFVIGYAVWSLLFFIPFDLSYTASKWMFSIVTLGAMSEAMRIIIVAWRKKVDGAWIVALGVFSRFFMVVLSNISNIFPSYVIPANLYAVLDVVGTYGLILSISIYLARQFAQTNSHLETQLVREVEHEKDKARLMLVEAENERRAKELEEARQLQLSMLPKKLPQIEGLEIAAYMKPATEVGGDYYDFHEGFDGTLTVAVGDATGHGLKAGSVVTATKSLFNAFAEQTDIPQIFTQTSGALKKMNLRGLFMALAMLKIKDGAMTLCVAGMPSVLIYRCETNTVEEISLRAVPLGSMTKTIYQKREISLRRGDCVVLMSDGFPEMFNPSNEMLGFEKAAAVLPSLAQTSSQEIINELVKIGENWADGRAADDDVTFVVLKVGGNGNLN